MRTTILCTKYTGLVVFRSRIFVVIRKVAHPPRDASRVLLGRATGHAPSGNSAETKIKSAQLPARNSCSGLLILGRRKYFGSQNPFLLSEATDSLALCRGPFHREARDIYWATLPSGESCLGPGGDGVSVHLASSSVQCFGLSLQTLFLA